MSRYPILDTGTWQAVAQGGSMGLDLLRMRLAEQQAREAMARQDRSLDLGEARHQFDVRRHEDALAADQREVAAIQGLLAGHGIGAAPDVGAGPAGPAPDGTPLAGAGMESSPSGIGWDLSQFTDLSPVSARQFGGAALQDIFTQQKAARQQAELNQRIALVEQDAMARWQAIESSPMYQTREESGKMALRNQWDQQRRRAIAQVYGVTLPGSSDLAELHLYLQDAGATPEQIAASIAQVQAFSAASGGNPPQGQVLAGMLPFGGGGAPTPEEEAAEFESAVQDTMRQKPGWSRAEAESYVRQRARGHTNQLPATMGEAPDISWNVGSDPDWQALERERMIAERGLRRATAGIQGLRSKAYYEGRLEGSLPYTRSEDRRKDEAAVRAWKAYEDAEAEQERIERAQLEHLNTVRARRNPAARQGPAPGAATAAAAEARAVTADAGPAGGRRVREDGLIESPLAPAPVGPEVGGGADAAAFPPDMIARAMEHAELIMGSRATEDQVVNMAKSLLRQWSSQGRQP